MKVGDKVIYKNYAPDEVLTITAICPKREGYKYSITHPNPDGWEDSDELIIFHDDGWDYLRSVKKLTKLDKALK